MEKVHTIDKENLFEGLSCSPISSSGCTLEKNRTERLIYSPLSEQNLAYQSNKLYSPGPYKTSKVGLFLSTPVEKHPLPENCSDTWEDIRKLDEEEVWLERTQVVTKEDHLQYCEIAKEIVGNIIENLPILNMDESEGQFDDTVVAGNAIKEDLVNGLDDVTSLQDVEPPHNGNDISCEEKNNDIIPDVKDALQNDECVQSSDQVDEKEDVEEDNDFINSCSVSELDTTVKEASANDSSYLENTISEEKSSEDLDETVREVIPDEQTGSTNTFPAKEDKLDLDPELKDDINLQFDEEGFKTSAAFGLELDFLEQCGNKNDTNHESDLARDSLYVKFDPLVEAPTGQPKQDSNGFSDINPADFLFRGPISGNDLLGMDTPPEKLVVSRRTLLAQAQNAETGESTNTSTVAPVDLFELSPSQNIATTEKTEEAQPSKSENDIAVTQDEPCLVQPLNYSKNDLDKAVDEEREKLLGQWNLQNSLHESEMEKLLDERNKILEERNKAMDENKLVKTLMMEYEETMARMIKDRENEQSQQEKSNSEIVQERDQLQRDLNNTERSFAHLHEKFGKLKTAVESYRKSEELLKKVVKDLQEDVKNKEAKYQVLKGQAEQKLQEADVEINRVHNSYKTELAGLQAALKREKTKNTSLQQSLEQKVTENKELTAICDELISKVGPIS